MVRFSSIIIFLFAFSLVLYICGVPMTTDFETKFANPVDSGLMISLVLGLIAGMVISALTGFAAIYAVPATILTVVLGWFILPSPTTLFAAHNMISYIVYGVYNTALLLALLSFIRGEI